MEHQKFDSIPRLYRNVVITEKLDGMNAGVIIKEIPEGCECSDNAVAEIKDESFAFDTYFEIGAQTRRQIVTPDMDNSGFAAWVREHARELYDLLGPGYHYGEWWGKGLPYSYHQPRNWFSLFNTKRWQPEMVKHIDGLQVVPVLYDGAYADGVNREMLARLEVNGSVAAQQVDDRKLDFRAEGIVGWHVALNTYYKVTLNGDGHKNAKRN